ncbi:hypothetical protein F5890DRAFT_1415621 [Lentinula detonsa]|uniref:BTB domain-containing protein n=1 Tax=Lentinula detonsa TaxID=2804962 RepID=A0AA38PVL7_9AGAR|nr:hypothetical protein F5890DRAFT_1415621 [Lentinula detonsa]
MTSRTVAKLSTPAPPRAPSLQEAIDLSTESWQEDLARLFRNAKKCFADVVWEVGGATAEAGINEASEEVWGHKAIVYARAPPSFQSRYFHFRPNLATSPSPSQSPIPGTSALSLNLALEQEGLLQISQLSRSPSPSSRNSPAPSTMTTKDGVVVTRLHTTITPALFINELEYLYTGQGFGEAFEFLYDSTGDASLGDGEAEAQEIRLDKLRKDLVFMWRSRLYSDVKISLAVNPTDNFSTSSSGNKEHENTTAVFSTHRFILVSRSGYFQSLLLPNPLKSLTLASSLSSTPSPQTLTLPSPPFTPASLHFTLGYLYTGTLAFSHRTYDLTTALHIYLSSLPAHLHLPRLLDEIRGRIVMELCHGLFHAFLEFPEYEALIKGRWGGNTGGCRCKQCARRAPRVLEFAVRSEVNDPYLDRGSRRALVGLLGDGWVTSEWAGLPTRLRESVLKGVKKRMMPPSSDEKSKGGSINVWSMLFAVENDVDDSVRRNSNPNWHETVRTDLLRARDAIDECLADREEEELQLSEWHEILLRPSASTAYEDANRVSIILASLIRGLKPSNAPLVYQTLLSNVLLLPAAQDPNASHTSGHQYQSIYDTDDMFGGHNALLLPPTSHVRIQVENARMEVLKWIRDKGRWQEVREAGGFIGIEGKDGVLMEGWALQEIADYIQVPFDELLVSPVTNAFSPSRDRLRPRTDADSASIHSTNSLTPSMRVSILSRNLPLKTNGSSGLKSSSSSVRSTNTFGTTNTIGRRRVTAAGKSTSSLGGDRPDSKLTPHSTPDVSISEHPEEDEGTLNEEGADEDVSMKSSTPPRSRVVSPTPSASSARVKKPANFNIPSVGTGRRLMSNASLASSRSSIRSTSSTTSSISLRAAAAARQAASTASQPRPKSAASTRSTLSTRSAASSTSKSSKVSTSTVRRQAKTGGLQVPPVPLPRPISASTSGTSTASSTSGASDFHTAPTSGSVVGTPRQRQRTVSAASTGSVRSTRSTRSTATNATAGTTTGRTTSKVTSTKRPPSVTSITASVKSAKGSSPAEKARAQAKAAAAAASGTTSSKSKTLSKKGSSDTIRGEKASGSKPKSSANTRTPSVPPVPSVPSTLTSSSTPPTVPDPGSSPPPDDESPYPTHLGATLSIGIPCIVSSKRKRFRALARYIGEVEGELGPWVGVEVPVNDDKGKDKDVVMGNTEDLRQWNDGTWRGIRYFDITKGPSNGGSGGTAEEWGDSMDDRAMTASSKRRPGHGNTLSSYTYSKGMKRRVDQWSGDSSTSRYGTASSKRMRLGMMARSASPSISDSGQGSYGVESRGLFVRPQQVLYVVDAIDGGDL